MDCSTWQALVARRDVARVATVGRLDSPAPDVTRPYPQLQQQYKAYLLSGPDSAAYPGQKTLWRDFRSGRYRSCALGAPWRDDLPVRTQYPRWGG